MGVSNMSEQETKTEHHGASSVPYNTRPAGLEKWADGVFGNNAPVKLPEGGRQWLADNLWWLALVGGVLSLWSAWSSYNAMQTYGQMFAIADELVRQYGTSTSSMNFGLTFYLALAAMVAQAVLLLMAYQKLKVHQKAGWNLIFYSSLVSLVTGALYLLTPYYGATSLVGVLIGVVIGWWLLFQIRGKFNK